MSAFPLFETAATLTCENHVKGSLEPYHRVKKLCPPPPRQQAKLHLAVVHVHVTNYAELRFKDQSRTQQAVCVPEITHRVTDALNHGREKQTLTQVRWAQPIPANRFYPKHYAGGN